MQVLFPRCCGLDVHKKNLVACVLVPGADGKAARFLRTFGTMTADLLGLTDWLLAYGVTHVAMESTGVYWKPVYNLLESSFELLLVNAQHIKQVPGRKTDVKDCEWIADLLQHGLLRASFVPERPERELRELTRYRTSLIRQRASEVNRLQKTLEGANIKLGDVVSDIDGRSAREMLEALVAGESDVHQMAEMARGRMREKIPQLERALVGQFGEHQRFLVTRQLAHIDYLEILIGELDQQVRERLRPFEEALQRLDTVPGVGRRMAEVLVAEIGTDMSRFPTHRHLASWAGICPGNHRTAGKRKSGKCRKGSPWLRAALAEAAQAAGRTKETYESSLYHRMVSRRGKNRGAVAVGHSLLVTVYHLLKEGTPYRGLGAHHFDERDRAAVIRRAVRRLEALGCQVTLKQLKQAA
jgi:transposase